jgi:glycosyltransferase involved in cell wall biosynthesis
MVEEDCKRLMKFSVVIPVFNRAELLVRAVQSVLQQSVKDWELIISDDASTEDIRTVAEGFHDPRIKYFRLPVNGGNAAARNQGARNAIGDYICYLDSDDRYHPDFLEKMENLIRANGNPGFLWTNVNRVHADGEIKANKFPKAWKPMEQKDPYQYFLKGIYFGTDFGFTVRRDCIQQLGYFDEQLRVAVDTDFILRIVNKFNFAYTDEILVDTFEHAGLRVRKNIGSKASSYDIIYEKHRAFIEADPQLSYRWRYKLMWLNYHASNKKRARGFWMSFLRSMSIKPLLLGSVFEILPVDLAVRVHKKLS